MPTTEQNNDSIEHDKLEKNQLQSNNLVTFSSSVEPNSMELNRRLKSFEKSVQTLENKLTKSHNEFRSSVSSISKKADTSSASLNLTQKHLRHLDNSYKSLNSQSDILAKKTASLGSLFEKAYKKQSSSFEIIDKKISKNKHKLDKALKQVEKNLSSLENSFIQVTIQTQQLFSQVNSLNQNLQKVSQEQNQQIRAVDSKLDLKITYLDNQIKQQITNQTKDLALLQDTLIENEKTLDKELVNVKDLVAEISAEHKQQVQELDIKLEGKTTEIKNSIVNQEKKLKKESKKLSDNISIVLEKSDKNALDHKQTRSILDDVKGALGNLTDKVLNFHLLITQQVNDNKSHVLSSLQRVDGELKESSARHLGSDNKHQDSTLKHLESDIKHQKSSIKHVESDKKHYQSEQNYLSSEKKHLQSEKNRSEHQRHIDSLQKGYEHLSYRADNVDESLTQLNKLSDDLFVEQKNTQQQVDTNFKIENTHFNSLSILMVLIIVVALSSFYYTWNTMSNDKNRLIRQQITQYNNIQQLQQKLKNQNITIKQQGVNEAKLKLQLSEVGNNLALANNNINKVNNDLNKQSELSDKYLKKLNHQQQKTQSNLQMVDEQMLYLSQTIGPFSELQSGILEGPIWLENQKSKNHTVKLKTFNSKKDLFAFIEKEAYYLKENIAFFPIKIDGKLRYTLAYGSFQEKTQAQKALKELPYEVAEGSEGIVKMSIIQALL